jgi:hemerythrin-like domain-containing protein
MIESGAGLLLLGCARASTASPKTPPATGSEPEEDVSPPEDLMREHGALNRILLIYEECTRRLDVAEPFDAQVLAAGADIIRRFIEQYHEKLEEDFLFPRFEKANVEVDLVRTLRRQHQAGRVLTDGISRLSNQESIARPADKQELVASIGKFVRMYRPHEAREDTVLFPALWHIVPAKEFDELGEQFEDKEHELFGKAGFEGVVEQVADLEKRLGIYELDAFTPA